MNSEQTNLTLLEEKHIWLHTQMPVQLRPPWYPFRTSIPWCSATFFQYNLLFGRRCKYTASRVWKNHWEIPYMQFPQFGIIVIVALHNYHNSSEASRTCISTIRFSPKYFCNCKVLPLRSLIRVCFRFFLLGAQGRITSIEERFEELSPEQADDSDITSLLILQYTRQKIRWTDL